MALPIAWPFIAVPLLPLLYRRLRLLTRRQPLRSGLIWARLLLLGGVLSALALSPLADDGPLLALLGGALFPGIALGLWGVRLTHVERTADGDFYTPNRWIGLALMAVLLARLLYRYVVFSGVSEATTTGAAASGWLDNYHHHPATLVLFGLLLGYYLSYNTGLLVTHHRHLAVRRSLR